MVSTAKNTTKSGLTLWLCCSAFPFFAFESKLLLDLNLNPQALAVKAVLPTLIKALHRLEALE